ncbi:5204_t:CDS:2 [Entrophospora sp. SA101]|nr:5204_t:CDS:2 [Entrophospora sp. SA101]
MSSQLIRTSYLSIDNRRINLDNNNNIENPGTPKYISWKYISFYC